MAADAPVTIVEADARPISGVIANFSERGVFIKADVSPAVQRPVHVHFILKPDHAVCTASGKVAWRGPNGVGILFDDVNQAYCAFVAELAKADESTRPGPKREVLGRIIDNIDVEVA